MERRTDRYRWTIASLVVQKARNPPAVQETQVPSLSREDPLEKGMATYSSILAMDRGAWWATVYGVAESQTQQGD